MLKCCDCGCNCCCCHGCCCGFTLAGSNSGDVVPVVAVAPRRPSPRLPAVAAPHHFVRRLHLHHGGQANASARKPRWPPSCATNTKMLTGRAAMPCWIRRSPGSAAAAHLPAKLSGGLGARQWLANNAWGDNRTSVPATTKAALCQTDVHVTELMNLQRLPGPRAINQRD